LSCAVRRCCPGWVARRDGSSSGSIGAGRGALAGCFEYVQRGDGSHCARQQFCGCLLRGVGRCRAEMQILVVCGLILVMTLHGAEIGACRIGLLINGRLLLEEPAPTFPARSLTLLDTQVEVPALVVILVRQLPTIMCCWISLHIAWLACWAWSLCRQLRPFRVAGWHADRNQSQQVEGCHCQGGQLHRRFVNCWGM
jgi:hypothetical protein